MFVVLGITMTEKEELARRLSAAVSRASPRNLINIRRTHVLDDGLKKLKKTSFVASRALSVKFSDDCGGSEGAVDLGGPTREFLRLAIRELFTSSGVFTGGDNSKVITLNSEGKYCLQSVC